MRKLMFSAALVYVGACSVFGNDDGLGPEAPPEGTDGGADAVNPVQGTPADFSFTLDALPDTVPIVQGLSAKVTVRVHRGRSLRGPITVKVSGLRDGVAAAPLAITGDSGTLEIAAPAAAAQGAADGLVEASGSTPDEPGGMKTVTTPLKTLVRGAPGTIDTTYGTGGLVSKVFGAGNGAHVQGLVLGPDDSVYLMAQLVVGGVAVAHIDPTGKLDPSYGTAGVATLGLPPPRQAALQPDGKLVIVSGETPATAVIARLDAKGLPDATFGTGSVGPGTSQILTGGLNGTNQGFVGVALRADGDIFAAWDNYEAGPGTVKNGSMRLAPNGTLRAAYGASGTARSAVGLSTAMTIRNNAKNPSFGNLVMIWVGTGTVSFFQTDGNSATGDPLFGNTPRTFSLPDVQRVIDGHVGLVELDDGSIITPFQGSNQQWYLYKFGPLGTPAAGFGSNGLAGPFAGTGIAATGIAASADGKILVALVGASGAEVVRLTSSGTIDTTFGNGGHAIPAPRANESGLKVVVQKSGRIILSSSYLGDPNDGGVVAVWP